MNDTSDNTVLSPLKRAFLALEAAQARVAALEGAAREPIAIVGLGCRVPGGGRDAQSFWRLMRDGVDAITRVPAARWDIEAFYDADTEAPGKIATREGGFLDAVDEFDPTFFGIAPREAQGMDPQQRLLLEVSWEALEHAGIAPDRLERSATGVYFGVCSSDYTYLQMKAGDPALLDSHFTSGIAHSVFSGRVSYLLGLQGPSVTLDTACSSSLVAVHLACQALRSGECRMALAGGVNLILGPDIFVALSHSRMLAPDGRCKTFDAAADGFARGEGCGVVVLKRLSDAQADGDRILAVIRGSAVNQDGASSGLTAPNGPAQEAVIREALNRAGVAPRQVGYIEAHGTGTQLGDPLEVHALGAVFGADRGGVAPLWIGSAKTNLGHLEAAAGVTGLIKVILSLQNRTIPRHLHFQTPSPHIHWSDFPLRVPTAAAQWEPIEGRRIAGISSFGFSGTNAHVVVEEAPAAKPAAAVGSPAHACLMTLSARDPKALAELAARYTEILATDDELADVCYTACAGRAHFNERATIIARSMAELRAGLAALARGETAGNLRTARVARRDPPRVAFLFTGQGAQYSGMGRGLYDASPAFREALDECARLLAPHLEQPLLQVIFESRPDGLLDQTAYTQPALFAVEYALARMWASWGIAPNIVMGHSVGELVAACVAGVFSLEDAVRVIARRGRFMQSLPAGGAMAAIAASEQQVTEALKPYAATVSIAAVNGPSQTVISGAAADVTQICDHFTAAGVRTRPLVVSHAFHSPLVEPVLDAFEREVATTRMMPPRLRLISNLTGRVASAEEVTQARYWRRHVREAVRFGDGLRTLGELQPDCLIEAGPHPTLLSFASTVFGETGPQRIASLRKGSLEWDHALDALASMYLLGAQIEWRSVFGAGRRVVDLPAYPFQRERCWFTARPAASRVNGRETGHALLGARLRSAATQVVYEARISADSPAFVREHRVQRHVVLPATAYLDTLLACARDALKCDAVSVEDVTVKEAMLLSDDGTVRILQTICQPERDGVVAAAISSIAEDATEADPWTQHVSASLRRAFTASQAAGDFETARKACAEALDTQAFYSGFNARGLDFGPGFRSVRELRRGESQALGRVELAEPLAAEAGRYQVHPVLLDGCVQVLAAALPDDDDEVLYLPIGIARLAVHRRVQSGCWSHAVVTGGSGETRRADIRIYDGGGALLAELAGVQLKRVARDALARLGERWLDDCLYETHWRKAEGQDQAEAPLRSPAELVRDLSATVPALAQSVNIRAYDTFLARLEALCIDYTVYAMRRLGWQPVAGDTVRESHLAAQLKVVPVHARLFARLLAILGEGGWLARGAAAGEWCVLRPLPDIDPRRAAESLQRESPSGAGAELELTMRVAAELAQALRGEREPMQLLFPGGSIETAERIYRDSPTARFYNGLMAEMIAAAARQAREAGRPLRILEIGAGTGGTTAHVLPRLPSDGVEYTFTDVGPLFVARARERFSAYGFVRYNVLDLERDPQAQGFAGQAYDLIIASNVIHATADLRRTLGRVRSLLAPGGMLAMLEVTAPQRWFDLTVGLTTGWWAFTDLELRPDYATLSRDRWFAVLGESGFEDPVAIPDGTAHGDCLALQSIIVASASRAAGARRGTWLAFADGSGTCEALAARLRAGGGSCVLVKRGAYALSADGATIDPTSPADYKRLFAEVRAAGRELSGVVHAWSLDTAPDETLAPREIRAAQDYGVISAMHVAQVLVAEKSPPPMWIVTRGAQPAGEGDRALTPAQATSWGLGKALALEHPELRCVMLDLDPIAGPSDVEALLAELGSSGDERHIAVRGGERRVARLTHLRRADAARAVASGEAWRLVPSTPGSLDAFRADPCARRAPGPGQVEVAVEATGLNFKDVLNALGMYPGNPGPLGGECAGRVVAVGAGVTHVRVGDEVVAVAGGSFASHVVAQAELVQPRPVDSSVEEAASFSIAYLTAEFCLGHLAKMRKGDRVLIHAAAGGVGMAAVRLAQLAGAEVFATAGSEWKRQLLASMGVAHVLDSRTPAFSAEILARTGGKGVDIVLNSLAGELIEPSFAALARGGRFVEIGKRGIKDDAWVRAQNRDWLYFVVDWGETAAREPALIGGLYARLVNEWQAGRLAPLPRHVFALDDASRAFRFMAQARHAGKIVVRHRPHAERTIRRNGTYLITGGLSGLGLLAARWLSGRGAGRLVLIGRRGVTDEAIPMLQEIRASGTDVIAEAMDVSDELALRGLLERVRASGPPLRGVLHSAGALDDASLLLQDRERFRKVFAAKVQGATLLDKLTRFDALDWFVLFASVAGVLGSPGQSNHSAANSFLDLLAHDRRMRGLPALSIDWGVWTQIGAAADRGVVQRLAAQGLGALTPEQGLLALQRLLEAGTTQAAVLPVEWARYLGWAARGTVPAFFAEVAGKATHETADAAAPTSGGVDLPRQLGDAPAARRRPMLAAFVRERALRALGVDPARPVDPRAPLGELGLDSLLAVELRNALGSALGTSLPATLLFDYPSIDTLTDYLLNEVLRLGETAVPVEVQSAAPPPNLVASIEEMSDDEVDRLIAARAQRKG